MKVGRTYPFETALEARRGEGPSMALDVTEELLRSQVQFQLFGYGIEFVEAEHDQSFSDCIRSQLLDVTPDGTAVFRVGCRAVRAGKVWIEVLLISRHATLLDMPIPLHATAPDQGNDRVRPPDPASSALRSGDQGGSRGPFARSLFTKSSVRADIRLMARPSDTGGKR